MIFSDFHDEYSESMLAFYNAKIIKTFCHVMDENPKSSMTQQIQSQNCKTLSLQSNL